MSVITLRSNLQKAVNYNKVLDQLAKTSVLFIYFPPTHNMDATLTKSRVLYYSAHNIKNKHTIKK